MAGLRLEVVWFNTPIFLLMLLLLLLLSLLPYLPALFLWGFSTVGGYALTMRRLAPHPLALWLSLAFPGALLNLIYGQKAFCRWSSSAAACSC